ncbi:TIGR04104 family putative zinc finger protein [Evansella cellulosilytica]|uniref:CXXC-20-CXXC protein n=1 Tax=Evansella cellulosilytica (strain ATCC 21833 / DSM 2522 / FERM P-1141 / JCM 9156 / N-4) TaxID=649639 RepID=E6U233_EVAC2|nr:TIGR04104 family putative zinc finger protein [Evansella cellulosilytica]ADU29277.1 hypothetical protein Bcell_1004 [Evansella cellulosilytica DSM 2522]
MKLPICWSCKHRYKYIEALRFLWSKECPTCNKRQYLTATSNWKTMLPTAFILLLPGYFIRHYLELPFIIYVYVGIGLFTLAMLITPFFLQFTNRTDPLN